MTDRGISNQDFDQLTMNAASQLLNGAYTGNGDNPAVPPTAKQSDYLKDLGYTGPAVTTMTEATRLIMSLLEARNTATDPQLRSIHTNDMLRGSRSRAEDLTKQQATALIAKWFCNNPQRGGARVQRSAGSAPGRGMPATPAPSAPPGPASTTMPQAPHGNRPRSNRAPSPPRHDNRDVRKLHSSAATTLLRQLAATRAAMAPARTLTLQKTMPKIKNSDAPFCGL